MRLADYSHLPSPPPKEATFFRNSDSADARIERERAFHDQRFAHDVARAPARKFYSLDVGAKKEYCTMLHAGCSGKRVLEYGCGPGGNALSLAQAGAIVTAIDISPVAIAEAQAQSAEFNVSYQVMNAESMSFPEHNFDLICGSGILHHLDLQRAFTEIQRTLRRDGEAVFLEPLAHNPFIQIYRNMTPRMRSRDEHPLRMSDLKLARRYFRKTDFQFFNLFTLFAAPIPKSTARNGLLTLLHRADQAVFGHLPWMRRYAWMTVIRLAEPAS